MTLLHAPSVAVELSACEMPYHQLNSGERFKAILRTCVDLLTSEAETASIEIDHGIPLAVLASGLAAKRGSTEWVEHRRTAGDRSSVFQGGRSEGGTYC